MTSAYHPTIAMTLQQVRDHLRAEFNVTSLPPADRWRPLPEPDLEIDALIRANAPVWSAQSGAGL